MQTPMQPPMQTDARADAGKPAKGGGKARPAAPPQTPLPPDWKPAEATAIEAKRLLRDAADDQLEKFVLTRRAKGETRADWDADFLAWCHRQVDFLARNPQAQKHMTMAIPGGRTEAAAKPAQPNPLDDPAAAVGPELGAQFVRVRNWLKFAVGPTDFAAHLVSMRFVGLDGDEVTVSLPSQFQADWARQHFGDKLLDGWQLQNPKISRVAFAVAAGDVRTATA